MDDYYKSLTNKVQRVRNIISLIKNVFIFMAYKTLVASSATQQRWTIDSNAHTLQELKEEFRQNNIPFEGLAITEGLCTKAELTRDDAEIPVSQRTVNYNGETYSRVFLITNARKQIASGSFPTNRKDFGEYIKKNSLGDSIKAKFGDNWTRISTDKLLSFFANTTEKNTASNKDAINEVREELKDQEKVKEVVNTPEKKLPDVKDAPHAATVEWFYDGIKKMAADNLLYAEDVVVLAGLVSELAARLMESKPKITASDMDDMLRSIRH
jgi:hypothetical protein